MLVLGRIQSLFVGLSNVIPRITFCYFLVKYEGKQTNEEDKLSAHATDNVEHGWAGWSGVGSLLQGFAGDGCQCADCVGHPLNLTEQRPSSLTAIQYMYKDGLYLFCRQKRNLFTAIVVAVTLVPQVSKVLYM